MNNPSSLTRSGPLAPRAPSPQANPSTHLPQNCLLPANPPASTFQCRIQEPLVALAIQDTTILALSPWPAVGPLSLIPEVPILDANEPHGGQGVLKLMVIGVIRVRIG